MEYCLPKKNNDNSNQSAEDACSKYHPDWRLLFNTNIDECVQHYYSSSGQAKEVTKPPVPLIDALGRTSIGRVKPRRSPDQGTAVARLPLRRSARCNPFVGRVLPRKGERRGCEGGSASAPRKVAPLAGVPGQVSQTTWKVPLVPKLLFELTHPG